MVTEPVALGLIKSPGEMGADIVVGEGQSIGVGLQFGGPYVGLFACREKHVRQMPGRLAGETVDAEGKRGFVLTLSTREQHIRREKATSNICTNSGLCALAFSVHLTLLGEKGLRQLAALNHARACEAAERLAAIPGVELVNDSFFNEFTLKLPVEARPAVHAMVEKGVLGGVSLGRLYPGAEALENGLVVAVTETVTDEDIDALRSRARGGRAMTVNPSGWRPAAPANAARARRSTVTGNRALMLEEPLIFEIGDARHDRRRFRRCRSEREVAARRPRRASRADRPPRPAANPRRCAITPACRGRITRSTSACSRSASCTMKHNPRLNEKVARMPGFADVHPLQPQETVQGALAVIDELAHWLLDADRHARRGDEPQGRRARRAVRHAVHPRGARGARRRAQVVLVPESAHGTNPATAAFAGYRVENIPANAAGPGRSRRA